MKIKILTASVVLALASISNNSSADEFEFSASATLVSQYLFRGLDASQEDPALQGDVTMTHDSGFWFGAWASNYDSGGGESGIEIDLMAGYEMSLSDGITIGGGLTQYTYSDETDSSTDMSGYGSPFVNLYWNSAAPDTFTVAS